MPCDPGTPPCTNSRHGFVERRAQILARPHLPPGVSIVAPHADYELTPDYPRHLETEHLAPENAVLEHRLRPVSGKEGDETVSGRTTASGGWR